MINAKCMEFENYFGSMCSCVFVRVFVCVCAHTCVCVCVCVCVFQMRVFRISDSSKILKDEVTSNT